MKVFGFAGYSGAGKTTLIEGVTRNLVGRGLRVSLVKHAHHAFDVDQPGKDSWRHRQAGCAEVALVSSRRVALMRELRGEPEPGLDAVVAMLAPCDVVLVEGYKRAPIPKLEVRRSAVPAPALHADDPWIVAVASDGGEDTHLPVFPLDAGAAISDFICCYLALHVPRCNCRSCTAGTGAAASG